MEVKKEALARALKLLAAAGCKFCVIDEDGNKHGELTVAEPVEKKRRRGRFARGAMTTHFVPFIQSLPEGGCALVPYGPFGVDAEAKNSLRSSLASHCSAAWGNQTYITHMNDSGIELLRVA